MAAALELGAVNDVVLSCLEHTRYERAFLDFEIEVRRRRDVMHAEHLANMQAILAETV
jgi:hypothetical protein